MKPRDRLVLCVLAAAAVLAVLWLGVVSPKRKDAAALGTQVTAAQASLAAAQTQVAQGTAAEAGYTANLRVVTSLYRAVPANDGVPALLVTLERTSRRKRVDFRVVTVSSSPAAASAAGATGLSPISFTFTFTGGYIALQHFLRAVDRFTLLKGSSVIARGRLLTIQSVALTPPQGNTGTQAAVTATAYMQVPATGTVGASAATPIPAPTTAAALPAPATAAAPATPAASAIPGAATATPAAATQPTTTR